MAEVNHETRIVSHSEIGTLPIVNYRAEHKQPVDNLNKAYRVFISMLVSVDQHSAWPHIFTHHHE